MTKATVPYDNPDFSSRAVFAESMPPLGEVFKEGPVTLPKSAVERRARTAAIADLRNSPEGDFFGHYEKMFNLYKAQIDAGQEEQIHDQNRRKRLERTASTVALMNRDGAFEDSSSVLAELWKQEMNSDSTQEEASGVMGDLLGTNDPDQIALYEEGLSAFQVRMELDRRVGKIMEKIEEVEQDKKDRFDLFAVVDFAFEFIPLLDSTSRTGNFDSDAVTKRWYDSVLAGERQRSEVGALWLLDNDEFDAALEEVVPAIQKSVTDLGYRNIGRELNILNSLNQGVKVADINAFNFIDNGPLALWAASKTTRAGRGLGSMLHSSGASSEASEVYSRLNKILAEEGEVAASQRLGEGVEELADGTLPTALNPSRARTEEVLVHPGAEAHKRYEMGQKIAEEIVGDLESMKRLTPKEQEAAVEATVQRYRDIYGKDRVLDWEVQNRTVASGINSPVVVLKMGTAKGGKFANENTAIRFLRGEGINPATSQIVGKARVSKPELRSQSKDPVIQKASRAADEAQPELIVNASAAQMTKMTLESGYPVKMLTTKDGNTLSWIDEGLEETTHMGVATDLGLSIADLGRLHFTPGKANKGVGFYDPELPKGQQKALGSNDDVFKFRNQDIEGPKAFSKAKEAVESLRAQRGSLQREIEDLKQSLTVRSNLSGDHLVRTQNIPINKRLREVEKELSANKKALRDAEADLKKEPLDATLVEEPGRGVYVEVEMPIVERGFFKPSADQNIKFGGIGRWLLGGRQLTSIDIFGLSVQSVSRRNKILSILKTKVEPTYRALSKAERSALDDIINQGEELAQWYDSTEIRQMYHQTFDLSDGMMPDRFQRAYDMYRYTNDLEYMLRADEVYSIKSAQGYQTVEIIKDGFPVSARNARVVYDLPTNLPAGRTYNIDEGIHYVDQVAQRYNAKALQDDGYVLVHTDTPHVMDVPNGTITVNNFIVRKGDLEISPLQKTQINYRPGGHRMYHPSIKWFVKQGRLIRQADTGEEFLSMPSTWKGGKSREELSDWVNRHNQGLVVAKAYRAGEIAPDAAKAQLNDIVDDVDGFLNDIDSGYIDPDIPFETVFDRDLPTMYTRSSRPLGVDVDNALPGYMASAETQGRMYYSGKGKPLTDPSGGRLRTLDAYQTSNRALSNIAQTIGFSVYKQRSIQKWLETYGPYLDARGVTNDGRVFLESTFKKGTPTEMERAALQERDVIRRVLNWTTPNEMRQQTMMRNLMVSLEEGNTVLGKTVGKQASKLVNWADEVDMLSKMRGFVFDIKLGLFSIAQLPLQVSTMFAAISIDPKHGLPALNALPYVRTYLTGRYSDIESLRAVVGNRTFGFDSTDDFIDMVTELRNGGFFDVNRAQVMVNDLNASNAFNLTGSAVSDFREAGRFFFYESERWNRIVAWQIAWKRARAKLGKGAERSDILEEIYAQADDLSMNMTEAGAAVWQKGAMSIPTQFWPYSNRLLEAAFGRQFSRQERMQLIVGQFLMYGSAGIPGIAWLSEHYQGKQGEAFDLAGNGKALSLDGVDPRAMLDRGAFDTMIRWASGNDVSYGERVGIGHFHTDLIREMFNMGRYGDTSSYELLTGATGSVMMDVGADGQEFLKYLAVETGNGNPGGPLTRRALNNLARNVSSYNNSFKAYMLWKYSTLESTTNNIIFTDGTKGDALAAALGIPPGENRQLSAAMLWQKDRSKVVDDIAKTIAQYRTRFAQEVGDRESTRIEMQTLRDMTPPDVWRDAQRRALTYTPEATLDSIGKSVTSKKAQEELAKDD